MFWSAPKKKKDDDKERQVKELKLVFPSIRRPNNDDNLFEIKFVVNNQYSSLRVFIPSDFPNTRPVLQASGPITHPWLDQFKQVNGSDKLMQWNRSSSLVEVVEESLSALLAGSNETETASAAVSSSPAVATASPSSSINNNNNYSAYPAAVAAPSVSSSMSMYAVAEPSNPAVIGQYRGTPTTNHHNTNTNTNARQSQQQFGSYAAAAAAAESANLQQSSSNQNQAAPGPSRGALPALPSSFPELDQLTSVQLQRLLVDEVALEAHLSKVESIKQMQTVVDQVRQDNVENARRNLSKEADLCSAMEEAEAQQSALKVLVLEHKEKLEAVRKKHETPISDILKELKATKNELDSNSEELGASFVEGKIELGNFLQDFLEKRSKYHELSAKMKIAIK